MRQLTLFDVGNDCRGCGRPIPHGRRCRPRTFCTKQCAAAWVAKGKRRTVSCERCGLPVSRALSQLKKVKRVYCSRACSNEAKCKGGYINGHGYRMLSRGGKQILEHRYVWERKYGTIPDGASIHHRNGIRDDNRIENLELWHGKHRNGQRLVDIVLDLASKDETVRAQLMLSLGKPEA